jgi:hypothetical protein
MPETEWNSTTAPEEGAIVYVLAVDDWGQYVIPFPVVFRDDNWLNARTGEELDTFIAGWREPTNYERRYLEKLVGRAQDYRHVDGLRDARGKR